MVGVSSGTTPHCHRDAAATGTGFRCQHVTVGAAGEVLQAGNEAADGAVAVGPADEFTQAVRGGLNRVGHDGNLEKTGRRRRFRVNHLMKLKWAWSCDGL